MTRLSQILVNSVCGALAIGGASSVQAAGEETLAKVKERGALACSDHNGSYLGMAEVDDKGKWKGFDIDLCRAVATAIFGDYEGHLNILPTSWAQRWPMLQSGELDVLIKATDWTMGRDSELGFQYSPAGATPSRSGTSSSPWSG
jgi:general L-amino acid transport system substrate-binding protein